MNDIYLLVTIDTEEDNWGYVRQGITVENIQSIPKVQHIFDSYGIRPVYLCNTPVVTDPVSIDILRAIFEQGKCDIGTHLHPWNSPPIKENLTEFNSQLKNLPYELIKAKLDNLTKRIIEEFGIQPIIFRAGRWGLGENVVKVLIELGYKIDTSVTPFTSWESYGNGSDFSSSPFKPYIINLDHGIAKVAARESNILEVPVSIGFNRTPFSFCSSVYDIIGKSPLRKIRLLGFCDRTRLLQKIWLSPEFNTAKEMLSFSKILLNNGINLLNFTFHSPSLKPGLSLFVRSEKELTLFLKNIEDYLVKLNSIGNVISVTSNDLLALIENKKVKCIQTAGI